VPIHNALATSSALGFPIAAASAIGYIIGGLNVENLPNHTLGYIFLPALLCISMMSMVTAPIGVKIAHQLNTTQLRRLFAVVLICIASYMLAKNVFGVI
jgi:uncharacterized membrane protein YfcA